jgi:hypothetical protein
MENCAEMPILLDIRGITLENDSLHKIKRPPHLRWAMVRFPEDLILACFAQRLEADHH